ncbi:GNAT family N-acetyltransferase [Cetobacterium somerae]|uniref:GNAT family N-acetyltransferase n=1 Tax=Cetobacterium somerae TaxID=188913 RepID=UPI003891C4E8
MNVILGIAFFILGSLAVYIFQRKKYKKMTEEDFVCEVVQKAFIREKFSDHNEHKLVRELLKSDAFVKDLSLTAKFKGMIVGYILFTKVKVGNDTLLTLAPLAVLPRFQKRVLVKAW